MGVGHYGLKPKTPDDRDFLLAAHTLPPVPKPTFGHANTYPPGGWMMNGNGPLGPDEVLPTSWHAAREGAGDCVEASWVNELKVALTDAGMTAANAELLTGNAEQALYLYKQITGYDPVTGAGDEGTEIRARLKYAQKTGLVDSQGKTHKIGLYVSVDPSNLQELLAAVYWFEAVPIGCTVTEANERAFDETGNAVWSSAHSPAVGGHCIPIVGRPDSQHLAAVTWGARVLLTEGFREKQVDEAWAYLSPDRISKVTGKSYEGASESVLAEYLKAVSA